MRSRIVGSTQNGTEYLYEALDYVSQGNHTLLTVILKGNKISKQALDTIYDLVWEWLNVGRVWLKFREERPFGIPVKEKRSHNRISA
jgi:hypothetical protein